ncbi:MAG: hypothetical protein N3D82_04140 [Ignisphaera sp.]|nr:hypothetical protein [Ignisphaera sp.]MCX8168198.1 hypothetical protein [Ignisphaera sp.]MDW8084932.1 hypothetical protein [Ignisphaera sp.]
MVIKRIAVIHDINYGECDKIVDKVVSEDVDIIFICGGIRECRKIVDVPKNVFGIADLEDDTHIIKFLKSKGVYIAGRWKQIEDICIGGVDAKNPIQNLSALKEKLPYSCTNLILLSQYPILNTTCSSIEIFKKKIAIGFATELLKGLIERIEKMVVVSCNKALDGTCKDVILDGRLSSVTIANRFTKLTVILSNTIELIIEH